MYDTEQLRNSHQPLIGVKKVTSTQVTGRVSDNIVKIQKQSIFKDSVNNDKDTKNQNYNSEYKEQPLKESETENKFNQR